MLNLGMSKKWGDWRIFEHLTGSALWKNGYISLGASGWL